MVCFDIVRHGQTLLNRLERAQGWVDSPLTEDGVQAAVQLGHKLQSVSFCAAYASDTRRAVQTAELILNASGNAAVPVQTDARLREWCLGDMEAEHNRVFIESVMDWLGGVDSFAALNDRLPEVADAIHQHDTTGMTEPFSDICQRLRQAFGDMAEPYCHAAENCHVLVVTHAFVIKTLFCLFAPERLHRLGKVENTITICLTFDGEAFALKN